jgi:type I restriction enzyme S subunit
MSLTIVPLREILTESNDRVTIHPSQLYKQLTVKLWGKGVVQRREILGAEIVARNQRLVHSQQFIMSRIDARHGAFGLVPDSLEGSIASQDFPVFYLDRSRIVPEFLAWMSKTRRFVDLCRAASEGTTNRVRLKVDRFLSSQVRLPVLHEQRRIVEQLKKLAIMINEALILCKKGAELSELVFSEDRRKTFQEAIREGSVRLDHVSILQRGKFSHRPRNEPRFFGGVHPWIQIAEIEAANKWVRTWNQTLNDTGLEISRKFSRGTVLVSIAATIGAAAILGFDCCVPDSIVGITPLETAASDFIYHYIGWLREHLEDVASQSAQKNINLRILGELPFPDVPLAEQVRISAHLDVLRSKVNDLTYLQNETSKKLDSLLASALERNFGESIVGNGTPTSPIGILNRRTQLA